MGGKVDRFGIIQDQQQELPVHRGQGAENDWEKYRPRRRRWSDLSIKARSLLYAIMTTGIFFLLAPTCRPCKLTLDIMCGQFGPIAGPLLLTFLLWVAIFGALTGKL